MGLRSRIIEQLDGADNLGEESVHLLELVEILNVPSGDVQDELTRLVLDGIVETDGMAEYWLTPRDEEDE